MKNLLLITLFTLGSFFSLHAQNPFLDFFDPFYPPCEELIDQHPNDYCFCCIDKYQFCLDYCDYWDYPYHDHKSYEPYYIDHQINFLPFQCECPCCGKDIWCDNLYGYYSD